MWRSSAPFIGAYALAMLPIGLVMASQTFLENLANPIEPPSEQNWDIRFTAFEVLVVVYIIGFICALPFFALLRWGGRMLGWMNYSAAFAFGAVTGVLALVAALILVSGGLDDSFPQSVVQFAAVGAVSGGLYWWAEQRLSLMLNSRTIIKDFS